MTQHPNRPPGMLRFLARFSPAVRRYLASVSARVDDSPGWTNLGGTQWDKPYPNLYQEQVNALEAWRKNPLAKRIITLTTDYVVANGITVSSQHTDLDRFIQRFWNHPRNQMNIRLPEMCNELSRAGELFPVLNINPTDGMSYVRFVPATEIDQIHWQSGDYETETAYHQVAASAMDDLEGRWWRSPWHPEAFQPGPDGRIQIMLHYAVNRPTGCVRGESDLAPILIWLRRYSQWLEDRVRLNWAARAFLWIVTVPTNKIAAKRQQYAAPPDPGSVIVKDDGEQWDMITPSLQARDASADGRQIRYMIGAGAGLPLHMLSEAESTNLATAQAQQEPTFRQFTRRQRYFCHILQDLVLHAYNAHARQRSNARKITHADIAVQTPEIIKSDNQALASAGREIITMLTGLRGELLASGIQPSDELNRRTLEMAFRFAGEVLQPDEINALLQPGPGSGPPQPNTEPDQDPDPENDA